MMTGDHGEIHNRLSKALKEDQLDEKIAEGD